MEKTHTSIIVDLHPIVTLNISDQWTRRSSSNTSKVFGFLSGKHEGLRIEIFRSSGLIIDERRMDDGTIAVDEDFFKAKMELAKEMFPNEDFIGWYICGPHATVSENERLFNRQFMKFTEHPLLLKFDAETLESTGQLNLAVYETVIDPNDETKTLFRKMPYQFTTEASELIGLEHMANFSTSADYSHTSASKTLNTLNVSMKVFHHRLQVAGKYLESVLAGEIQPDQKIISGIFKLCLRLKALKTRSADDSDRLICTTKQVLNTAAMTALLEDVNSMAELLSANFQDTSAGPGAPSSLFRRMPGFPINRMQEM